MIPDIEKFLPVAIFKMATTIPHNFNIVRFQGNFICRWIMMSRIDSRHWTISTDRHFQNGRPNTAKIQHCPISSKFDMWVDNDFPTLKNFYRSPFSKWLPQYCKNSTLFDSNVLNWFLTLKNFYRSPLSNWLTQYHKNSR